MKEIEPQPQDQQLYSRRESLLKMGYGLMVGGFVAGSQFFPETLKSVKDGKDDSDLLDDPNYINTVISYLVVCAGAAILVYDELKLWQGGRRDFCGAWLRSTLFGSGVAVGLGWGLRTATDRLIKGPKEKPEFNLYENDFK